MFPVFGPGLCQALHRDQNGFFVMVMKRQLAYVNVAKLSNKIAKKYKQASTYNTYSSLCSTPHYMTYRLNIKLHISSYNCLRKAKGLRQQPGTLTFNEAVCKLILQKKKCFLKIFYHLGHHVAQKNCFHSSANTHSFFSCSFPNFYARLNPSVCVFSSPLS